MSDWDSIALVPAMKRLVLSRVGCWAALKMEFLPGLNVITEIGSAWGKSTILRSIRLAINPGVGRRCPLTPQEGSQEGCIAVDFMCPSLVCRLAAPERRSGGGRGATTMGQRMLTALSTNMRAGHAGMGLLIDEDATSLLDRPGYGAAVTLLNTAPCQVICVVGSGRFALEDFPAARVFACARGEGDTAEMKVLQAGNED